MQIKNTGFIMRIYHAADISCFRGQRRRSALIVINRKSRHNESFLKGCRRSLPQTAPGPGRKRNPCPAKSLPQMRPRKSLYASMIVLGLGCLMLGRLFQCVWLWTGGSLTEGFQIGILGAAGAFSFFFSSNFGQIDSLVDDGGKSFRRWRIIAWLGPVCIAALYVLILLNPAGAVIKASFGFTALLRNLLAADFGSNLSRGIQCARTVRISLAGFRLVRPAFYTADRSGDPEQEIEEERKKTRFSNQEVRHLYFLHHLEHFYGNKRTDA